MSLELPGLFPPPSVTGAPTYPAPFGASPQKKTESYPIPLSMRRANTEPCKGTPPIALEMTRARTGPISNGLRTNPPYVLIKEISDKTFSDDVVDTVTKNGRKVEWYKKNPIIYAAILDALGPTASITTETLQNLKTCHFRAAVISALFFEKVCFELLQMELRDKVIELIRSNDPLSLDPKQYYIGVEELEELFSKILIHKLDGLFCHCIIFGPKLTEDRGKQTDNYHEFNLLFTNQGKKGPTVTIFQCYNSKDVRYELRIDHITPEKVIQLLEIITSDESSKDAKESAYLEIFHAPLPDALKDEKIKCVLEFLPVAYTTKRRSADQKQGPNIGKIIFVVLLTAAFFTALIFNQQNADQKKLF